MISHAGMPIDQHCAVNSIMNMISHAGMLIDQYDQHCAVNSMHQLASFRAVKLHYEIIFNKVK